MFTGVGGPHYIWDVHLALCSGLQLPSIGPGTHNAAQPVPVPGGATISSAQDLILVLCSVQLLMSSGDPTGGGKDYPTQGTMASTSWGEANSGLSLLGPLFKSLPLTPLSIFPVH